MTTHDTTDSGPSPGDSADLARVTVAKARALIEAQRALLVDVRDRRLYDNTHAEGALSVPLAEIEGAALPADRLLILYCA